MDSVVSGEIVVVVGAKRNVNIQKDTKASCTRIYILCCLDAQLEKSVAITNIKLISTL